MAKLSILMPVGAWRSREELKGLLSHLGSQSMYDNSTTDLALLVDSGSFLERTVSGGGGPPRRRVTAHAPCECPEMLDTLADACLTNRLNQATTALSNIQGAADSTTASMLTLRMGFNAAWNQFQRIEERIPKVYQMVYKGMNNAPGIQAAISQHVLALREIAKGLSKCLNFYWGQSFLVYDMTQVNLAALDGNIRNLFQKVVAFVSDLQRKQEAVNYANSVKAVNIMNGQLKARIQTVNGFSLQVYKVLNQLSASMGKNEGGTNNLARSLQAAGDLLSDKIGVFSSTAMGLLDMTAKKISDSLTKQTNAFQAFGRTLVAQLESKTAQKLKQLSAATDSQVAKERRTFVQSMLNPTTGSTRNEIQSVSKADSQFVANSRMAIFTATQKQIDALIASNTKQIEDFLKKDKSQLDQINANATQMSSVFSTMDTAKAQGFARLRSLISTRQAQAGDAIDILLAALPGAIHTATDTATSLVANSVKSVDAEVQTNIDKMVRKMMDTKDSLAAQDSEHSLQTTKLTGDIRTLVVKSVGSVGSSSDEIDSDLHHRFEHVLGTLGGPISTRPGDLSSLKQAGTEEAGRAGLAVQTTLAAASGNSTRAVSEGESTVQVLLATLLKNAGSGKLSVDQIRALLAQQMRAGALQAQHGQAVDAEARRAVAGGADQVAIAEEGMGGMLGKLLDRMDPSFRAAAAKALSSGNMNAPTRELMEAKSKLDQARVRPTDLDAVVKAIHSSGADARSIEDARRAQLGDWVEAAGRAVSLAVNPEGHAYLTQQRIARTNAQSDRTHINPAQLSVEDLSQLRSSAAHTDAVLSQSMGLLKSLTPTLEAQLSALPGFRAKIGPTYVEGFQRTSNLANSQSSAALTWADQLGRLSTLAARTQRESISDLANLNSRFNSTASATSLHTQSGLTERIRRYAQIAQSLSDQMGLAGRAVNATSGTIATAAASKGLGSVAEMETIQSRIDALLQAQVPMPISVATGGSTANSSRVIQDGIARAAISQQLASNFSLLAKTAARNAEGSLEAAIAGLGMDSSHGDAVTGLKMSLEQNQLQAQAELNRRINEDSRTLMDDYNRQLSIQKELALSKPEAIYNALMKNKANVSQAIGRMINSVVAGREGMVQNATAGTRAASALVRNYIGNIHRAFNYYTKTYNTDSKLQDAQDNFDSAIKTIISKEVVKSMHDLQYKLNNTKDELRGMIYHARELLLEQQESHHAFDAVDLKMRKSVASWQDDIYTDTRAINGRQQRLSTEVSRRIYDVITGQINSTISNLIDTVEAGFKNSFPRNSQVESQLEKVRFRFPVKRTS